jgi:class 3 adenylate cyclase
LALIGTDFLRLDRHAEGSTLESHTDPFGKALNMAEQPVERRLAAILAADVAGYGRLMGADEEGTLARLNAHRTEFLEPTVAEYRGRVVKRTGDGILVEFGSAVDAARCAIKVQQGMRQRNADVSADQRIEPRRHSHRRYHCRGR